MLAAGVIRDDLQAHLALARVGEQPRSSTPISLPVRTEAVSQTLRGWPVVFAGGCVVGDVSVVSGVVSAVGAVSGPHGGYPVAIDLGEVVGHHQ